MSARGSHNQIEYIRKMVSMDSIDWVQVKMPNGERFTCPPKHIIGISFPKTN